MIYIYIYPEMIVQMMNDLYVESRMPLPLPLATISRTHKLLEKIDMIGIAEHHSFFLDPWIGNKVDSSRASSALVPLGLPTWGMQHKRGANWEDLSHRSCKLSWSLLLPFTRFASCTVLPFRSIYIRYINLQFTFFYHLHLLRSIQSENWIPT